MRIVACLSAAILLAVFAPSSLAAPEQYLYSKRQEATQEPITCQDTVIVEKDASCTTIAEQHQVSLEDFRSWNPSINDACTNIYEGQTLCVSAPAKTSDAVNQNAPPTSAQNAPLSNIPTPNVQQSKPESTNATTESVSARANITANVAVAPDAPTGLTVALVDSKHFCLFLPRAPGNQDPEAIANSEKSAVAFCTQKQFPGSPANVGVLPSGFIQSANFQKDAKLGIIQVTGTINRDAYDLAPTDGGGQYDNHGAGSPPHSKCKGYPYYVSLIEPDINGFCIRCCKSYNDCHAGRSQYGCQRVVPPLNQMTTASPNAAEPTNSSPTGAANPKKTDSRPSTHATHVTDPTNASDEFDRYNTNDSIKNMFGDEEDEDEDDEDEDDE